MSEDLDRRAAEAAEGGMRRRGFLKVTAAATAAGALDPRTLVAAPTMTPPNPGTAGSREAHRAAQEEVIPLGNGEPPALQFQAWPGGTGALLEKYWRAGMNPFEKTPIDGRTLGGARAVHRGGDPRSSRCTDCRRS